MSSKPSVYIFKSFKNDFLYLLVPAIAMFIFLFLVKMDTETTLLAFVTLLTFVAFDAGHSMYTFVRMTTIKGEWKSSRRFILMPLIIFLIIFIWAETRLPYLFSMIVYYSAYHYAKQHWGILRWYERINSDFYHPRKYFLYSTFILPFVAFHFRDPSVPGIYGPHDFIFYPSDTLFSLFFILSIASLTGWIVFEFRHRKTHVDNAIWIIVMQLALHMAAILFGLTTWQVFGPVLTMHAVSYFVLSHKVYEKNVESRFQLKWILGVVVAIVCLAYPMRALEAYRAEQPIGPWLDGLILAIAVTPGLVHYHFDAFLWKHSNPSFAKVFTAPPKTAP